jgi:3-oxoacyl-[acyl-carrier protein] reductase
MVLTNKKILITGASEGFGKLLSLLLAEKGARVILLARSEKKLQAVASEIQKYDGRVSVYVCDISKLIDVQKTTQEIIKDLGVPDIIINNAGIWTSNALEKKDPTRRQEALNTNTLGTIQLTEAFLPFFKEKNAGHIINIISTSGIQDTLHADNSSWKTYGATKWAITGYTNALQKELQQTGIQVTGFFPGGMDTDLFVHAGEKQYVHQPWMMNPQDVADIILFILTRPESIYVEKMVVTKKS